MSSSALDSGWFVPLPKAGSIGPEYGPSSTGTTLRLSAQIRRNPNNVEAVEHLASHYQEEGDGPSLTNLMEGWAKHLVRDGRAGDAATAFVRGADAAIAGSGDFARAERLLTHALRCAPEHERALRQLHALLAAAGNYSEAKRWLVFVADALARHERPCRYRARVCYRLGRLLEDDLSDSESALPRYAESLRDDRDYEPARRALGQLQDRTLIDPGRAHPVPLVRRESLSERHKTEPPEKSHGELDSLLTRPSAVVVSDHQCRTPEDAELLEVNLGATTESNFYAGFSSDPCRTGVFAATYRKLPPGSTVPLLITFPGGLSAPAEGRVRFVRDGGSDDGASGVGVQLTKLTSSGTDLIARFMKHRPPLFYSD